MRTLPIMMVQALAPFAPLFSLDSCDTLTEEWERSQCSGGVFMENEMTQVNPNRPSKYLKADQPLYPCAEVKSEYKTQCYGRQTGYALKVTNEPGKTVQEGFAKVFGLCAEVEDGFRTACYSGLEAYAANAARESSTGGTTDGVQAEAAGRLCMLDQDDEALSNCVLGAVRQFIFYYDTEVQAKALCQTFQSADSRAECLQATDEEMANRQS